MPILIRPSKDLCKDFLSRPKTMACRFPTGWDFYFSLPIDVEWLHHMNPEELELFSEFLWHRFEKITGELGSSAINNVIHIQQAIDRRRSAFKSLSPCQQQAWIDGYGVPVFDKTQRLVEFIVDRESIEFDQQVGSSIAPLMDGSEKIYENSVGDTCDCIKDDETVLLDLNCDGNDAFEVRRNGATKLFGIYGGLFKDYAQWAYYRSTLWNFEIQLLKDGELQIANMPDGSWELVEGPLAYFSDYSEHTTEVPDSPNVYQSSARGSPLPTKDDAPEATKYSCPSCETDPGTSRTATPTPVDSQHDTSDETDNDRCDHCTVCRQPMTQYNTPDDTTNESKRDSSYSPTKWNFPLDMFGAAFGSHDEWLQFKKYLTEYQCHLLYTGKLRLSGNPEEGITFIPGPLARSRSAKAKPAATKRDSPNRSASTSSFVHPSNPIHDGCSNKHTRGSHSAPTVIVSSSKPVRRTAGQDRASRITQQVPHRPESVRSCPFSSRKD